MNAHAQTEEKSDKAKSSFHEELQLVFPSFSQAQYENSVKKKMSWGSMKLMVILNCDFPLPRMSDQIRTT